nr:MAG TPA: hypothetical protein [Caudoviricetes sp.]
MSLLVFSASNTFLKCFFIACLFINKKMVYNASERKQTIVGRTTPLE